MGEQAKLDDTQEIAAGSLKYLTDGCNTAHAANLKFSGPGLPYTQHCINP